MSLYHNNLDSVYNRKPQPIERAILVFIADQSPDHGGAIEDVKSKADAIETVLTAIVSVLSPQQKALVAQSLRLKPASEAE